MAALLATRAMPAPDRIDPLMAAINHFIFSGDAYDALPEDLSEEEDAEAFERLCNEPDRVLKQWGTPATSYEGAIAALRLALDDEDLAPSLIKAALAYFDRSAAQ
ncbi:hypothetical protein [Mesorhizobium shangrilense]|uniref:CdiI immunity protein domain-containing protein n=1 Tax=Mesorhizobium shangrilense TaxID=460060 RepID=A0ABV2DFS5_9HYPH